MTDSFYSVLNERALTAAAALLIHVALAGPRPLLRLLRIDRPSAAFAAALRALERKLNRAARAPEQRALRGALLVALLAGLALLAGALAHALFGRWHEASLAEAAALAALLGLRQQTGMARSIAARLEEGNITLAREELAGSAWRNAAVLDAHALMRAAVETSTLSVCERVIAPLFWYLALGLPGAALVRAAIAVSGATFHARDYFGRAAEWLQAGLQFIPSVLTELFFLLAAALFPYTRPVSGMQALLISAALPFRMRLLTVAGALLNLSLGGPLSPYAQVRTGTPPWLGGVMARAMPRDARRAGLLIWGSVLIALIGLLALGFFPA